MEYLSEVVSFVLGLFGGVQLKVRLDRRKTDASSNSVSQKRNTAQGDIVGRDKVSK